MTIAVVILFITGIIKFINVWMRVDSLTEISANISDLHDLTGVIFSILVLAHLLLHWKWLLAMTKSLSKGIKWNKKTLNYFIDMGMLISFFLVFITGLIKFPSIITSNEFLLNISTELLIIHDWSGLILQFLGFSHIILHWKWIVSTTRKIFGRINLYYLV